ncbi:MAG: hypothetical protein EON58_21500, partial [Alphaproteobacteria bacterium]
MLRGLSTLFAISLGSLSLAGSFSVTNNGWSGITGNAQSVPGGLTLLADPNEDEASMTVTCTTPTVVRTGKASWNFEVEWKPSFIGETAPASIKVEISRVSVLNSAGDGWCTVEDSSANLLQRINSQDFSSSGDFCQLGLTEITNPVSMDASGKYFANFVVSTDLIKAKYN